MHRRHGSFSWNTAQAVLPGSSLLLILTALTLGLGIPNTAQAEDFSCVWDGTDNDWDESAQWTNCNGGIPNNGAQTFDATINAGTVDIDAGTPDLQIEDLFVNGTSTVDHRTRDLEVTGVANIAAGATYNLTGSGEIIGGMWTGEITAVANQTTFVTGTASNNFTLTSGGTLTVGNSTDLRAGGEWVNNGLITLDPTASGTGQDQIILLGDWDLGGNGVLQLNDQARSEVFGSAVLTNGANHTIQGTGEVGTGQTTLINNGLITANAGSGQELQINTLGTRTSALPGFTNNGTASAVGGSTLSIIQDSVDNSNGVLRADGANSIVELNNTAVLGGDLTTSGGGLIVARAGTTVGLDGVTLTSGTELDLGNSSDTVVRNTITNNGLITFDRDNASFQDQMLISNHNTSGVDATFSGNGTVRLTNDATSEIIGGGELVNDINHTIEGNGQIGVGNLILTNNNLISANVAGGFLEINTTGTRTSATAGMVNNATMNAVNGGILDIESDRVDNNGTISADGAGSRINISNSRIDGGIISATNGATVTAQLGTTVDLDSVTLATGTNFDIGNSTDLNLIGTITNNGTMTFNIDGGNGQDQMFITNTNAGGVDTTLTGNGVLRLTHAGSSEIFGGGELVNDSNHTIEGLGQIGVGSLQLRNENLISANVSGGFLEINTTGTRTSVTAGMVNNATMNAVNGGILDIESDRIDNTSGLINADGAGSRINLSNSRIDGGTISSTNGATVTAQAATTVDLANVTLASGTDFDLGNSADMNLIGTITNNGTMSFNGAGGNGQDQIFITNTNASGVDTTLAGNGVLRLTHDTNSEIFGGGELVNDTDHTIEGNGQIGLGSLLLTNNGTINANTVGRLEINTTGTGTSAAAGFTNNGTARAETGGTLEFRQDRIVNNGTLEALDGGNVIMTASSTIDNNVAGVLTGGTYRAVANGNGARVQINGDLVTTNSAEIELSGAGSTFETRVGTSSLDFEQLESTLTTNSSSGVLRILDNRDYDSVNNLSNNGELQLGGGTLDNLPGSSLVNNGPVAEIHGFGTLADTVSQSGGALVRASGGNLTVQSIIGSNGDTTIDAGASLTINSSSNTGTLTHNGTDLDLGASNFQVRDDYANANFGSGNAFDGRANVSGSGAINATSATQEISGDVLNPGTDGVINLSFGNVRQGDAAVANIQVTNNGTQTTLRGAVQNTNAGDLTVSASDFVLGTGQSTGNIAIGASTSAGGAINGTIDVVNNFDNVGNQQIVVGNSAVYREADFSITGLNGSGELDFGTFLDTDGAQQIVITINNTGGPNDGFTEDLLSSFDNNASGAGTVNLSSNSLGNIVAGGSDTLTITLDPTSLGNVAGNITANFQTAGEVNSVDIAGLAATSVGSQIMNLLGQINGTVGQLAQPTQATPNPVTGTFRVGDPALMQDLTITNNADAQFGETLSAAIGTVTGTGVSAGGTIGALAGQQTSVGDLNVNVSTAAAGNITGNAELLLTSNGEFNGGQTTALASQNVAVDVDVFNAAAGTVADVDVGNYRVGSGMVNASLDATNTAPGGAFTEELRVDVTGSTGANASGNGALIAGMNTGSVGSAGLDGTTAGVVNGTVDFNLVSDGSNTSGLADLAVGSGTANVTGTGYRAADFSITGLNGSGELDFGTFLDTDGAQQIVITINNTGGPNDGFTEDLLSSFDNNASGAGTVNLSSNGLGNIVAGGSDTLTITLDPTSLGNVAGNITANFQTAGEVNSVDIAGLAATSVGSQIMNLLGQINGTVGQLAQPSQATPNPITGTFRVGDPALMQNLTISNNADAQFGETLAASFGTVDAGIMASGTIAMLAGQQTSSSDLSIAVSTATAGTVSGNAELLLTSNGEFNNGQSTALGAQNIAVDVDVYAVAEADVAPQSIDFGTVRVGDVAVANVNVGNTGAGALVDDLAEVGRGSTGPFGLNGAAVLLGAGQTTALQAEMATGTAGTFNGQVSLDFASRNPVLADLGLGTETVLLTGTVNNLADVLFAEVSGDGSLSQTSGNAWLYDFGDLDLASVNGQTFSAELGIGNGASGPADNLEGLFSGLAGAFALAGTGFDPLASLMAGGFRGDMLVSIVANSLGEMLHTVTFDATSAFAGLVDIDLGQFSLTFRANFTDGVGVPEPGTWLMIVFGMGGLLIMRRRVHGLV